MTFLLVFLTIALFLLGDGIHRMRHPAALAARAPRPPGQPRVPRGVFFANSHTWLELLPDGRASLGVDDLVAGLLRHPRLHLLKDPGARVRRGEPLLCLADDDHALTVPSPIDGRVAEAHPELERPGALGRRPFCEGWACRLVPERMSDLKSLLMGEQAAMWMREETRRLRDLLVGVGPAAVPVLPDGGPPVAGALRDLPRATVERFEREFLQVR